MLNQNGSILFAAFDKGFACFFCQLRLLKHFNRMTEYSNDKLLIFCLHCLK